MTVEEAFNDWLKFRLGIVSASTVRLEHGVLTRAIRRFWIPHGYYHRGVTVAYRKQTVCHLYDFLTNELRITPPTMKLHRKVYRMIGDWLIINNHIPTVNFYRLINPFRLFKPQRFKVDRKQPFTEEEFRKMVEYGKSIKSEWATAVFIAWHTSMRLGDALQLQWSQFRDDPPRFVLMPTKTKWRSKTVVTPINVETYKELLELTANTNSDKSGYLMPELAKLYERAANNTIVINAPFTTAHIDQIFRKFFKKAGVPWNKRSFHSLRVSYCTRKCLEGCKPEAIMSVTGQGPETFAKYIRLTEEDVRKELHIDD